MSRCRPPSQPKRNRLVPSLAFPVACECGYHFRTVAKRATHRLAYGVEDDTMDSGTPVPIRRRHMGRRDLPTPTPLMEEGFDDISA